MCSNCKYLKLFLILCYEKNLLNLPVLSYLLLGISENIYSQDLIVTTNNDSISCKVLNKKTQLREFS